MGFNRGNINRTNKTVNNQPGMQGLTDTTARFNASYGFCWNKDVKQMCKLNQNAP